MKAAVLEAINSDFKIVEISDPIAKSNHEIVKVNYCSLNHRDHWIKKGQYAGLKFPIVLGSDICGVLHNKSVLINPSIQWGNNESAQSNNYEILGLPSNGGLAEFVSVPSTNIINIPDHLTDAEAAAIPLAGLTAYRVLMIRANAQPGQKVFITGIGGGVALFAMQFALKLNCDVYVSSSSDEKIDKAIAIGAKAGINYKDPEWNKKFIAQNGMMDIIIDGAGGKDFAKLIKIARPGGSIALYGATNGTWEDISVQQIFWKQLNILGSTMGSDHDFTEMIRYINFHKIKPIVDQIYSLENINEAMMKMSEANQFGKIIIQI